MVNIYLPTCIGYLYQFFFSNSSVSDHLESLVRNVEKRCKTPIFSNMSAKPEGGGGRVRLLGHFRIKMFLLRLPEKNALCFGQVNKESLGNAILAIV